MDGFLRALQLPSTVQKRVKLVDIRLEVAPRCGWVGGTGEEIIRLNRSQIKATIKTTTFPIFLASL